MLFNSLTFFAFLAIVFTFYWLLKQQHKLQNLFILASSYFFYACWDWRFLILIVISSTADFFIGKWIGKCEFDKGRKQLLATSVFLNLALLGFFKYFNFFIEAAELGLKAIAPLWIPPDSVMQNPKFYFDYGHLNADGAKALTPFLEDRLSHLEL
jgi:D-alanyl-lipoteichoic acid acyltransferase DltB (MBOAT superfamily)